jgi:hypothetical protein
MSDITLGQRGCLNADLELAQSQAFAAEIIHQDPDGHVIDHSGDQCYCRLQREGFPDVVLDACVTATPEKVTIAVPGSTTAEIAAGSYKWDLFAGDVRLLYGKAKVYDTYARDTDG